MTKTKIFYGNKSCWIDNFLLQRLENVKKIIRRNWDCVILIDGMERSGKSTLGMTCGWYLAKGKFGYENVASDSDDAIRKCESLPDKSVLMLDEGSLIFSSKDTMKAEQKKLIKIMNVIGQKNMIFIVVLPSFFELNKFIAVNRSRFLLHVYTDKKMRRGKFTYFGEKKKRILYEYGRKHFNSYKYPRANFIGEFNSFIPFEDIESYKEIKKKSLFEALHYDPNQGRRELEVERNKRCIKKLSDLLTKKGIKFKRDEVVAVFETSNGSLYNAQQHLSGLATAKSH